MAQEDSVVITATRAPRPSLEIPASVDRLYADELREGRPQVNLSESVNRVPGIVIQDRGNYAQDFRVQSRGFGARAAFGVRGIRLIADGIPATMPDGQGQGATLPLRTAESIEVLRGPFSSLYGNASGGVIVVETEDPPEQPFLGGDFLYGSFGTWRAGARFGGYNALLDMARFETDGYREHSAARRDHYNLKLRFPLTADTALSLIGNQLRQPQTQDPLGLTRAQFDDDPRQATPEALLFDTRKTVYQEQLGARLEHRLSPDSSLQATVYGGTRWVEQYLAFAGSGATSSGGVIQLDRGYGGGALRFSTGNVVRLSAGVEYERMDERRRGFENLNGVSGGLRRDEDNTVASTDFYAQAEWRFAERWHAHGGVRTSRVAFRSEDHFIAGPNPDDSGAREYSATTPLAGLLFQKSRYLGFYATVGRGFETPTFVELAHQNAPASGLNFNLGASRSTHMEAGAKAIFPGKARLGIAVFDVQTKDEIVVDQATGGRTTFKNAGRTERRGYELGMESVSEGPLGVRLAYTRLDAVYRDGFVSGGAAVPAGNLLPAVPRSQVYAQIRYRRPAYYAYAEGLRRSRVAVNDENSEFADAYTVFNLVGGLVQRGERWRVTEFVRLDNVTDRTYAGSVIVNDGNGRFYEPAPRRGISGGIQASLQF